MRIAIACCLFGVQCLSDASGFDRSKFRKSSDEIVRNYSPWLFRLKSCVHVQMHLRSTFQRFVLGGAGELAQYWQSEALRPA
eukprot:2732585-Alexandrium_andersonii.AAC.1